MTQDPHEIALKLTKAQRDLLLSARETIGGDMVVFHGGRREAPFRVLAMLGLAVKRIGIADCITPLGLTVRTILQSQEGSSDAA